jgi:hypothetical protein
MGNVVPLNAEASKAIKTTTQDEPEFITYKDIDAMNDEQLDAILAAIRARRMNSYVIYKRTKDDKAGINDAKARARVEKKCDQIIRKMNTIDKSMDDLERYVSELRGLRLQVGLELI